jgi:phytoene synthase
MTGEQGIQDPERALAVAHAPVDARAALDTLFRLDERMGGIVGTTSEPMIGLMRLAWWRESLEKLDTVPAPAEPLLQDIARDILPLGVSGATLAAQEDGWAALLDGEMDEAALARHGRERGRRLFEAAALLLRARDDRLGAAGAGWALADLGHRHSDSAIRRAARDQAASILDALAGKSWPRAARPLAMLAVLARADAHASERRRQGSPRRVARMLALRLAGR